MKSKKSAPESAAPKAQTMTCAAPPVEAAPGAGKRVNVHHLTRVEGHGNIVVEIDSGGTVRTCRWEVPEAPRFFEAMVIGKHFNDIHWIMSRICGICAFGHQLASLQATEDALGVTPSEQTTLLRKMAKHAENMQSHMLHIGYLVLPDLLGVPSVVPLAQTHPAELKSLVALHRLGNEYSRLVAGRQPHPQRMIVGGFTKIPTAAELKNLRKTLEAALPGVREAAKLLASLAPKLPAFERETEYVALTSKSEYALLWGEIGSTHDKRKPVSFYKDVTREHLVPHSTAKHTKNQLDSYAVGALARYNLNADKLSPFGKEIAAILGLKPGCKNPFYNTVAQMVEYAHGVADSISLIDRLLARGLKNEPEPQVTPRAGRGVGAVEVPRGILFHSYEYDDNGRVVAADCVIPTNQNHANIQKDLEALTPLLVDKTESEIELAVSMLVRAYDPCISCSTHVIDLTGQKPRSGVVFRRV